MSSIRRFLARALAPALVLALALPVAACGDDEPTAVPIEETTFEPTLGVNLGASTRTESGLYYRTLADGTGATVATGQLLTVGYAGWLANGSQFAPRDTIDFRLGAGDVIPGWDLGIAGMRVGGRRQLIIPASLAYGPAGRGPIPGNAVLVFEVQVISAR